jgi:hypothetical protein
MTSVLVLIPALIAIAMLNMQSATHVARKLYVPVMMLMPLYMQFKVGGLHVTPTTFLTVFIAVAGLLNWYSSIRFGLVDACVVLYAFSAFYADFRLHTLNVAIYAFLFSLTNWIFPYIVGRTLIEQTGTRTQFAQMMVACLAIAAVVSLYEYKMENNLFQAVVEKIEQTSLNIGHQTRFGFARITGPYGLSIIAGMIFSTGLMVQIWLAATKSWSSTKMLGFLRGKRKPLFITLAVGMGLVMTGSRGPWIGVVFGLVVASIGFAKDRKRAAVLAIGSLIVAGSVTYTVLNKYTDVDVDKAQSQDQQNAAYRRDMLVTYGPLIQVGGVFGLGTPMVFANGIGGYGTKETSIDNEYLRVTLQQGYLGVTLFVLILALTMVRLVRLCATMRNRDDMLLAYCFLGAMVAASFTLTTVFLGDPMLQILFLLVGWVQSIRPTRSSSEQSTVVRAQPFQFQRVFA